jgi:hypothetical protein
MLGTLMGQVNAHDRARTRVYLTILRDMKRSLCGARTDELHKLGEGSHFGKFGIVPDL